MSAYAGEGNWVCQTVLAGAHNRTVRCVSWSPCGRLLAATSFDGTSSIWSSKTSDFECIATLEGHENEVKSVAWSTSGTYLATCSRDKSVWIFEGEMFGSALLTVLRKSNIEKMTISSRCLYNRHFLGLWHMIQVLRPSYWYQNLIPITLLICHAFWYQI